KAGREKAIISDGRPFNSHKIKSWASNWMSDRCWSSVRRVAWCNTERCIPLNESLALDRDETVSRHWWNRFFSGILIHRVYSVDCKIGKIRGIVGSVTRRFHFQGVFTDIICIYRGG